MPSAEHWDARIGRRVRLRDLHVLLTVVQRGSMAKAAQHLSITQPAVSKSIADLEHALGVRLLDRGPQGVEPTPYGKALVRRGLTVFDELRQGIGEIESMAEPRVGQVRVGCPETLAATLLPPVVERLSKQHPGITFMWHRPIRSHWKFESCATAMWSYCSAGWDQCSLKKI
jgi:DNA-binding transcriptional LysR family regulator